MGKIIFMNCDSFSNNHIDVLKQLYEGKRIYREGDMWRVVIASMENGVLITRVTSPSGGDQIIADLLAAGMVVKQESKASEYHGYLLRGKKPPDGYMTYDPRYRVLHWSNIDKLVLTEKGREFINSSQ